ncbi:F0F1 ATP synthase subunit A [Capnocytophaga canis]|uniref:F0F1 ATP synthase subunit A n=1 Tax=Capnocytophaga TaxID=1016 RepID=UPI000BB1A022|nr:MULTISPECIES: F0F1 ATP synthase subunit A [Capnocytophaga]ATA74824.1 ATP synthase F0 subunit A [Capnocytophaga sp. H2931]GIM61007.1 ATP synthase subunit a [Capnocytophaga canis]
MVAKNIIQKFVLFLLFFIPFQGFSSDANKDKEEAFDPVSMIMHHISNSHEFHITDFQGKSISMPLPVILWTDNGLITFMSSEFHHDNDGKVVVEKKGMKFARFHEVIHYTNPDGSLSFDKDGHVTNTRPLNFSITKNVFSMILVSILLLAIFIPMAKSYKKNPKAPKGMAGFLEPLVLFVRDDIAIPQIGEEKYARYMPYLLTIFFLIWFGNLFGLIPFFPFASTLTNDILFTGFLAIITFFVTVFSSNKNYWKHIFATPGVPFWLLPIMIPVEILGMFTKPFALMVRLFANITAGHIIILSLISLIFIFKTVWVSPVSIAFALFINVLELLVAALQAYVFTLLSALFIGQAVEEHHH